MALRRVVITGLGAVTPLGVGLSVSFMAPISWKIVIELVFWQIYRCEPILVSSFGWPLRCCLPRRAWLTIQGATESSGCRCTWWKPRWRGMECKRLAYEGCMFDWNGGTLGGAASKLTNADCYCRRNERSQSSLNMQLLHRRKLWMIQGGSRNRLLIEGWQYVIDVVLLLETYVLI